MKYHEFVDYTKLDPVKKAAIEKFSETLSHPERLSISIVPETLGESAVALDFLDYDFLLAFNVEGLGTKNMVADSMSKDERGKGYKYYEDIGKDTVAMSTNDLLSIGADPIVYGDIISSGDSNWFADEQKAKALLEGFRKAANELGVAIPCGETPTLKGIVAPHTLDMAGASVGIIKPKNRLILGKNIAVGDAVFGLGSSGVHSNGISLIRKTVEALPQGYFTELPESKAVIGEELLKPTTLYTPPVIEMLEKGAQINYLSPITGHGWKKIMRAKKPFHYELDSIPKPQEIFTFLQQKANLPDSEAYYTWNMGVGYALVAPKESEEIIRKCCENYRIECHKLGVVREGEKKVAIRPKNIVFEE